MKTSKFTDEQIALALRQAEAGTPVGEICRELGVSELRELRQLREENRKLKGLVADRRSETNGKARVRRRRRRRRGQRLGLPRQQSLDMRGEIVRKAGLRQKDVDAEFKCTFLDGSEAVTGEENDLDVPSAGVLFEPANCGSSGHARHR